MTLNEAEAVADEEPEPPVETVTYKRRKRRGHRQEMLDALTVDETIHYRLPEDERVCGQCIGPLHEMSTETRRELTIIPAEVKVIEHVRHVYACRQCEKGNTSTPVVTAPMPKPPISGSFASASSIAYIMDRKYAAALPLYRMEQELKREGIELSRQTMGNWTLKGAELLAVVWDRMKVHLLTRDIVQADETRIQVLKEPGRSAETQSCMWLFRSGRDGPPVALFDYQQTRAAEHPIHFLADFSGYLQVDGYAAYERVPDVTLVGCWAHARRKCDEALKALGPSKHSRGPVPSQTGLAYCNKLFSIEKRLKDTSPEDRKAQREQLSAPVLKEFKAWLMENHAKALPKSPLGKAMNYCLNQWPKLAAFLEDGRLEISNNRSERALKPFVIGRKNWLFANTPRGARTSAVIYSVVETAKENGLNPFRYLRFLFEQLPNIDVDDSEAVDALLPWSQTLPGECYARRGSTRKS